MSEDGEKDQEKNEETSSRPVSASARRKQRSSGDAASGNGGSGDTGAGKSPAPKGKASGGARASAGTRDKVSQAKGQDKAKTEGKTGPTPKRDAKTRRQDSLVGRFVRFLREVWGELKKVVWPTRKQMGTYTAVVLVFLAFMISLVFGLDYMWGQAVGLVFGD